jgi:hypothetical protein
MTDVLRVLYFIRVRQIPGRYFSLGYNIAVSHSCQFIIILITRPIRYYIHLITLCGFNTKYDGLPYA